MMKEKIAAAGSVGFEKGGARSKAAVLHWEKGEAKLIKLFEVEDPADAGFVDHYISVTVVPTNDLIVRSLSLKLQKEKEIDEVLEFQAEPLFPYPLEHTILDRTILATGKEGSQLTLFAIRKDLLKAHLESWRQLDLEPEIVTCEPAALAVFSLLFSPVKQLHHLLNIGDEVSSCLLVQDGKVIAAQAVAYGREASELPLQAARAAFALSKQTKEGSSNGLMVTGKTDTEFSLFLSETLELPLIMPEQVPGFREPPEKLLQYAVSIGAALTGLPFQSDAIDFRQKEFEYPFPWKRMKKPVILYFILCLGLAGIFYLWSHLALENQEHQLQRRYMELLTQLNKSYPEFEKEGRWVAKDPSQLTPNDLGLRLDFLEQQVRAAPETFALFPDIPRVSDLLAWLNSRPLVINDLEKPLIELKSFSYKMVKKPDQRKLNDHYQVKVELEFSSPLALYAREFHEMLLAPNEFVDNKQEVKWNPSRGNYRVSFFLKDRTRYPVGRKK